MSARCHASGERDSKPNEITNGNDNKYVATWYARGLQRRLADDCVGVNLKRHRRQEINQQALTKTACIWAPEVEAAEFLGLARRIKKTSRPSGFLVTGVETVEDYCPSLENC